MGKGFSKLEKKQILLSDETLLGLRMPSKLTDLHVHVACILVVIFSSVANSFIDLVRYMFSLPEVKESCLAF